MPVLREIECSIELNDGDKLPEHNVKYKDGAVECYIAAPDAELSFSVHLVAKGYHAPGLAAFVYIDGVYQCNRNNESSSSVEALKASKAVSVDLRLRQKEEKLPDGSFIGRSWSFAKLREAQSKDKKNQAINAHLGKIEVLVLRCHYDSESNDAAAGEKKNKPAAITAKTAGKGKPVKDKKDAASVKEASEGFGGMFGLFDGTYEPDPDRGYDRGHPRPYDHYRSRNMQPSLPYGYPPFTGPHHGQYPYPPYPGQWYPGPWASPQYDGDVRPRQKDKQKARKKHKKHVKHAETDSSESEGSTTEDDSSDSTTSESSAESAPKKRSKTTKRKKQRSERAVTEESSESEHKKHKSKRKSKKKHKTDKEKEREAKINEWSKADNSIPIDWPAWPNDDGDAAQDEQHAQPASSSKSKTSDKVSDWANDKPDDKDKGKDNDGWGNQADDKKSSSKSKGADEWANNSKQDAHSRKDSDKHKCGSSESGSVVIQPHWTTWREPAKGAKPTVKRTPLRAVARSPYIYPAMPPPTADKRVKDRADCGVQIGAGAAYVHKTRNPTYIDDMAPPYAVFTFHYCSCEKLEELIGRKVSSDYEDVVQNAKKVHLMSMSKQEMAEELLRLRENRGSSSKDAPSESTAATSRSRKDKPSATKNHNDGWNTSGAQDNNKGGGTGWNNQKEPDAAW